MSLKSSLIRTMFEAIWASNMAGTIRRLSKCRGVIFTLHRVLPDTPADFAPNAILQVTPDFLAFTIERIRELGFDITDLDEALRRVRSDREERPFAVFTFDDAYRDNLDYALPVLKRLNCPFVLYVPTALVDGNGEVWWQALEDIIAGQPELRLPGGDETFRTATLAEKEGAYEALYWRMRRMPEPDRLALIKGLGARYGLDLHQHCRELIMDWEQVSVFAREPLCTIGAHTVHHFELSKLAPEQVRNEIRQSVQIIADRLGQTPVHFSYPIGGRAAAREREFAIAAELGLASAVTTRPGGLYREHRDRLLSLPRISLNGNYQARRYVDVFATGALFTTIGKAMSYGLAIQRMIHAAG